MSNTNMKKRNIIKILEYFIYIIVIIFALLAVSSKFSIGGLKLLVVKSGSMEPVIKTGSIVIDKNFNSYNIGDTVTFKNKDKPLETTTHRLVDKQLKGNTYFFTTKGDANDSADFDKLTEDRIVGKVMFSIPYFGYAAIFARTLAGLILIIIIPATIIIFEEIKKIHHETKQIVKRRREKKKSKIKTENKEGSKVINPTAEIVKGDNENDAQKSG